MGYARVAPVGNIHDFSWFEVGEFFRFNGVIFGSNIMTMLR